MKNKKLITILLIVVLLLTGCTKQLKDEKGKIVKNEETGQTLPSNIMCQPTDKDIRKLYEDNKVALEKKLAKDLKNEKITKSEYNKKMKSILDINKLPKCSEFKITSGGYEGLWTTVFIKPLTWVLIKLGELLRNYGLAIIVATMLIRLILYPITKKTLKQSEMMKKIQPEVSLLSMKHYIVYLHSLKTHS